MKNLNEYIQESLLDDEVELVNSKDSVIIKPIVLKFLQSHYVCFKKDNIEDAVELIWDDKLKKFIVNSDLSICVKDKSLQSLTNEYFEWGNIKGGFSCENCTKLKSLEGSPRKVGGYFHCGFCQSLITLEGAPKEVKGNFDCNYCFSLKSLVGAPKEVRNFDCSYCSKLKSLIGLPKKVLNILFCAHCGKKFYEKDITKICKVISSKIYA